MDSRAKKLAKIIVDYSVNIQPKDVFLIQSEHAFKEYAEYIGKIAEERGAEAIFDYGYRNPKGIRKLVKRNNKEELKQESKRLCDLAEKATARTLVNATTNPYYLKNVEPKKIADYQSIVVRPFLKRVTGNGKKFKGLKWNIAAYPCKAEAKAAGMAFKKYKDFVYGATNINWEKTKKAMQKIKNIFDDARDIHIICKPHTDLHLSLRGRGGKISAGTYNMPAGEVYYGPVENSANGKIYFPYTSVRDGNEVKGIKLEYKNGKVKSFSAEKNQPFLKAMLNLSGVKRIGELGIGTNYGIKKYTQNLLFDEKIGGTIHLAIGNSYSSPLNIRNGGGLNKADIHWDLVCDLRKINGMPGGEIYVDGKLIQKNGKFLI